LDVQDIQTKEAQEEPASKTPCDVAGMDNGEHKLNKSITKQTSKDVAFEVSLAIA
jgi:hypothetical protein